MDDRERERYELELAKVLGRELAAQRARFEAEMLATDDPVAPGESSGLWSLFSDALEAIMRPALSLVAARAGDNLASTYIGIDWNLGNQTVASWASEYTFERVAGITATTRSGLQKAVADYYAYRMTRGELVSNIARLFGPGRASTIAVTEVTRAAFMGNKLYVNQLEWESGVQMVGTWRTNVDDLVCPICGPLNGAKQDGSGIFRADSGIFDGPPAHVNCRCWVGYTYPED